MPHWTLRPLVALLVFAIPAATAAHGGKLDAHGCHADRRRGDYHCHRGPFAAQRFASQSEMLHAVAAERSADRPPSCVLSSAVQIRTIARVVDGDTLVLDNAERVRLIGVDTPETVHPRRPVEYFAEQASAFTKRMASGKTVLLEFDQANAAVGHKDKYGRTLAYVYLPDGVLLNRAIILQGYGHVYSRLPFRYLEDFRAAERDAREHGRGLWANLADGK